MYLEYDKEKVFLVQKSISYTGGAPKHETREATRGPNTSARSAPSGNPARKAERRGRYRRKGAGYSEERITAAPPSVTGQASSFVCILQLYYDDPCLQLQGRPTALPDVLPVTPSDAPFPPHFS